MALFHDAATIAEPLSGADEKTDPDEVKSRGMEEPPSVTHETKILRIVGITPGESLPSAEPGMTATDSPDSPLVPFVLAALGSLAVVIWGLVIRRWWYRRKNPAIFRKYD